MYFIYNINTANNFNLASFRYNKAACLNMQARLVTRIAFSLYGQISFSLCSVKRGLVIRYICALSLIIIIIIIIICVSSSTCKSSRNLLSPFEKYFIKSLHINCVDSVTSLLLPTYIIRIRRTYSKKEKQMDLKEDVYINRIGKEFERSMNADYP